MFIARKELLNIKKKNGIKIQVGSAVDSFTRASYWSEANLTSSTCTSIRCFILLRIITLKKIFVT